MRNARLAIRSLQILRSLGVRELCICPGARNSPWIALITQNPDWFQTYYFFEERCASFFALGRIRQSGHPVAVLTTSGTAVGELLPATMEAHYARLPLFLVTADRPRTYRGTGAPQTAEQVGIFGTYVAHEFDWDREEECVLPGSVSPNRPIHWNVCFDEPLLDANLSEFQKELETLPFSYPSEVPAWDEKAVSQFFNQVKRPIAIVGMLPPEDRETVAQTLARWKIPVYLEALSGLREDPRLRAFQVFLSDKMSTRASQGDYPFDGVIRLGGVPTLRMWRDLEGSLSHLPVLSWSRVPFSGLSRSSLLFSGELSQYGFQSLEEARGFYELDRVASVRLQQLLLEEPRSEPGMIAALSRILPARARVYLGNSLPIRNWDLAASLAFSPSDIWASRGLNGIDGQISTFLGFSSPEFENWGIFGDLTTLYDLPGPWVLNQLSEIKASIVVVNNEGGKIFSSMFPQKEFLNQHQIRFGAWAELWGLSYEKWKVVPQAPQSTQTNRVIELLPDEAATQRFWKKFQTET